MQVFVIFVESPSKSVHSDLLDKLVQEFSCSVFKAIWKMSMNYKNDWERANKNENSMLGEWNFFSNGKILF